jgi:hypothetical protein
MLRAALVGVNQWLYVLVGTCPASVLLSRACRLRSAIHRRTAREPGPAAQDRGKVIV